MNAPPGDGVAGGAWSRQTGGYFGGARILNIPVPQTGHTPFNAGRPLAIFTCWPFEIFRFALHFTQ